MRHTSKTIFTVVISNSTIFEYPGIDVSMDYKQDHYSWSELE